MIADTNIDTMLPSDRANLHSRVREVTSILLDLILSINCPHVLIESNTWEQHEIPLVRSEVFSNWALTKIKAYDIPD